MCASVSKIDWVIPVGMKKYFFARFKNWFIDLIVVILNNQYESYDALEKVNLETLEERRKFLCLKFANNSLQGEKSRKMFPLNQKKQNTFKGEKFKVKYAKTERLRISAIPYMQRLLNEHQG